MPPTTAPATIPPMGVDFDDAVEVGEELAVWEASWVTVTAAVIVVGFPVEGLQQLSAPQHTVPAGQ
jgi:hypothetical protein